MTWNTARSYDHAYIRNIEDSTGETVAQVLDLDDYANDIKRARLIAAAPELLAALKDCRAWIAQYHQLKGHEAASLSMTDYLDRVISNAEEVRV
jgi:hypothetical protein